MKLEEIRLFCKIKLLDYKELGLGLCIGIRGFKERNRSNNGLECEGLSM